MIGSSDHSIMFLKSFLQLVEGIFNFGELLYEHERKYISIGIIEVMGAINVALDYNSASVSIWAPWYCSGSPNVQEYPDSL